MKYLPLVTLFLIILLSTFLRFYNLSAIPPALSWDEASVGYDAYAINTDGKDQWGVYFPIIFKSFGENKYPIHIYATAISERIFGLNDFAVRFPAAFFGVINIFLFYKLTKKIIRNDTVSLLATFLLCINPLSVQFSRVNWETNFTLFFFFLGLWIFIKVLDKRSWLLMISFLLFGVDVYTYNAAKVFIPLFIIILVFIYKSELLKNKIIFLISTLLLGIMLSGSLLNPDLSGLARYNQVSFDQQEIKSTYLYQTFRKSILGKSEVIARQYISQFSPQFLFISGDKNPRHSIQTVGEIYWFEIFFIPFGLFYLIKQKKSWCYLILLWFFLSPVPSAIVRESPHAARSLFILGGWQIVSALGLVFFINLFKGVFKQNIICLIGLTIFVSVLIYVHSYFIIYPNKYSNDWQFGYKKLFQQYGSVFDNYDKVLISDHDGQPYIFALYYLKFDPQQFRQEVKYNPVDEWGFSTVSSFSNFIFKPINKDKLPKGRLLVFASPDEIVDNNIQGRITDLSEKVIFNVYEYYQK